MKPQTLLVFSTPLGWMAMIAAGATVRQLTFGHRTAAAAKKAALKRWQIASISYNAIKSADRVPLPKANRQMKELVRRLRAYASGSPADFRDVTIDAGPLSEFQRRVIAQCRRIRYGATVSYAELAARAGRPGAARAVGNCMAANRFPLLVPCHRVVCSDGRIGSYSAPGGADTKRRLLAMESGPS